MEDIQPQRSENINDNGYSPRPDTTPDPVVPAPIQIETTPPPELKPNVNSPHSIVLQWLTYAFWGWTVFAMSILTITVLAFNIAGADIGDATLYGIAAVLVLLPISVLCDIFYIKHEPGKKTGASSVVMIIHAVLFALLSIGALITTVFSLVSLFISSAGTENTMVILYSALIVSFLFALVFLRTILPTKMFWIRRYFIILMVVIVGAIITMGVIGPVADARLTRNDKLIASNLYGVKTGIDDYVAVNKELPNDLESVKLTGDEKKLVTNKLVTFKKDSPLTSKDYDSADYFYFQLCVNYQRADKSDYSSSYYDSVEEYSTYPSTYSHPAGETCYKLKTENASTQSYYDDLRTSTTSIAK